MKVGLETSWLKGSGAIRGVGRYVTAVLDACAQLGIDVERLEIRGGRHAVHPGYMVDAWRSVRDVDLFHAPTPLFDYARVRVPVVCTMMDAIQLEVPSYTRFGVVTSIAMRRAAKADAVLTLSEYSKGVLVERVGVQPEKVIVAPLPVSSTFLAHWSEKRMPCPHGEGCVLAYADFERPDPRKRYPWLVPVAREVASAGGHLCIVGRSGTSNTLDHLRSIPSVHFRGPLDDSMLAGALRSAEFLCFPSAYEGQGMPLLEAFAFGTPVVAFANTSIPMVVRTFGVLIEEVQLDPRVAASGPHHPDDEGALRLAGACAELLKDGSHRLRKVIEAGDPLAGFSSHGFAKGIRTAYQIAVKA